MTGSSPAIRRNSAAGPLLPEPLAKACKVEVASLDDVPDAEALSKWLMGRGLSTVDWGKGDTKSVDKFWKEIQLGESGLEVWKTTGGQLQPVRVTHVLRAKVCSPASYERGTFLFNTWQQFADGRKRNRNALLSEKLSMDEVPLEEHLHEVCVRAVTTEEMQQVVEAAFAIGPGSPAPEFDPSYECPLTVESEHFVDYTIEVETSKSFPGLITMYHLYTVDIICRGLPGFDFNTLEFEAPDAQGRRRLKYVHAWIWLDWPQIQRYLFEGSELKERKKRGSFPDEGSLRAWLSQFNLDLDQWGKDGYRPVEDLFGEVEREETQLELWDRHDGVPLLMRVVHVLQLEVMSTDPRLSGKFLFQTWQQKGDCRWKPINRLMAEKLSFSQVPFDETRFVEAAEQAVRKQLSYLMDVHFQLPSLQLPEVDQVTPSQVKVHKTKFRSHHYDVEESPSFKGMHTMYHIYGMEVKCEGLPLADFTSLDFGWANGPWANNWRWVSWPQIMDILHARTRVLERKEAAHRERLEAQFRCVEAGAEATVRLAGALQRLQASTEAAPEVMEEVQELVEELQEDLSFAKAADCGAEAVVDGSRPVAKRFPPAMVSKLASNTITSETFLEEAQLQLRRTTHRASITQASSQASNLPRSSWGLRCHLGRATPLALGLCCMQVVLSSALLTQVSSRRGVLCVRALLVGAFGVGGLLFV